MWISIRLSHDHFRECIESKIQETYLKSVARAAENVSQRCLFAELRQALRCLGIPSKMMVFDSRKGSRPSTPPSLPNPDCLKPPKAIPKSLRKRFWPTVPERSCRATV